MKEDCCKKEIDNTKKIEENTIKLMKLLGFEDDIIKESMEMFPGEKDKMISYAARKKK